VAEQRRAQGSDADHRRLRKGGEVSSLIGRQLIGAPRGDLGHRRVDAFGGPCRHLPVGVTPDNQRSLPEALDAVERLAREGSPHDVAAEQDEVDTQRVDLREHRVERRKIAVNVVKGGDPLNRRHAPAVPQ
jgi:hypothetical protein